MRIIKPGIVKDKEWVITCHECGCVFAFDRKDIYPDQKEVVLIVFCPTCRKGINIDEITRRQDYENE